MKNRGSLAAVEGVERKGRAMPWGGTYPRLWGEPRPVPEEIRWEGCNGTPKHTERPLVPQGVLREDTTPH